MITLSILIGDDSFAEKTDRASSAVDNMFVAMAEVANYKEAFPIRTELKDDIYVGRNIVPYAAKIHVRTVKSADELIREAEQSPYDLVVTDLEYGNFGGDRGGINVINNLQGKNTLALCTS